MSKLHKIEFSRQDTKLVKGVAIILMLFHHLAAFPERLPKGFNFEPAWPQLIERGYLKELGFNAKICVALFFFLGGYGLYLKYKSNKLSITKSVVDIYKAYWKVFLIFVPIGLIFFARQGDDVNALCTRFFFEERKDLITALIANFTGWSSSLNDEWWFFCSYICVLPLGYVFLKLTKKINDFWVEIFAVFVVDILLRNVFPGLALIEEFKSLTANAYFSHFCKMTAYASCFFAGIVFAKYNGICKVKRMIRKIPLSPVLCIVACGVLWWSRTYVTYEVVDIIYCAILVPMISIIFDGFKFLKPVFSFLGKHSTNMWLCHSFFCYYFYEATLIVYKTKSVFVDFLILLALSLVSSILIDLIWKAISTVYAKIPKPQVEE